MAENMINVSSIKSVIDSMIVESDEGVNIAIGPIQADGTCYAAVTLMLWPEINLNGPKMLGMQGKNAEDILKLWNTLLFAEDESKFSRVSLSKQYTALVRFHNALEHHEIVSCDSTKQDVLELIDWECQVLSKDARLEILPTLRRTGHYAYCESVCTTIPYVTL
jgi:hypothetical protein